jgi:hypothetical protein
MFSKPFHRVVSAALVGVVCGSLYSCAPNKPGDTVSPTSSKPTAAASKSGATPTAISSPASPAATSVSAAAKVTFKKPSFVHGIYLTAWAAGSPRFMKKVYAMLDRTVVNSVVIDVRDTGEMYFPTHIKLSDEVEGKQFLAIVKPEKLMAALSAHNVWPIARIACFRDNLVPKKHPEMAVQYADGRVWKDKSGHSWLDPYNKKNWQYIAETVEYAMDIGFPEIQLDYVRFPSEGKSSTQVFPAKGEYGDPKAKPEDVIAAFATYIHDKVKARGVVFSADIFGIISSTRKDQGIGQELEKLAAPFDVISPMVYPSHFHKGEYGIADPNSSPSEIITKSLTDFKRRLPDKTVRPWLQDFSLGVHYGPTQVLAQINAAKALGYTDWLLWNARNVYTESALLKKDVPAKSAK